MFLTQINLETTQILEISYSWYGSLGMPH